jgi:hypothetical protein
MPERKPAKNQSAYQSRFPDTENPFLTDMADQLWATIKQKGTPVSKEELLRRAAEQKKRTDN